MLKSRDCINGEQLSSCLIKELRENMPYLEGKDIVEFSIQVGNILKDKTLFDKTMLKENILDQLVWGKVKMYIDWDKLVLIHKEEWRKQLLYFDELGIVRKKPYFAWDHFEKRMEIRFNAPVIEKSSEKNLKRKEENVNQKGISNELVIHFQTVDESERIILRYFIKKWNAFNKFTKNDKFINAICSQQKVMFEYCVQRAIENYINMESA